MLVAAVTLMMLVVASVLNVAEPRIANAAPPYVACSAEQIRATQRWWFFGNRAVFDFGASGTTRTESLNPQNISISEGSTIVSDTSGQLLFYSDGLNVWNSNHQTMPNGTGLVAAPSATQTVASFPSLTRPGIYFVVSNGGASESGGTGPLRYSEVDMSQDGGLGDVNPDVKNILLDGGASTATEGMTAVPNADGTGFWVITATGGGETGNKNMVAHEFDGDGPTGTIVRSEMSTANGNQFGTINMSQDMTKLVQHLGFSNGTSQLRLMSFDAETGVITELVSWNAPAWGNNGYSADFSPDGRWVYATRIFGTGRLFRYDIQTHTTKTDLEANAVSIDTIGSSGGQVRRGPDGKMYVARQGESLVGVVNDPNNVTDPDFVSNAITLPGGAASSFGLPQTATGCPIPKTAPSNLTAATAGYDKIDLSWSAPIDDGGYTLLGYKIERSLDESEWTTVIANTGSLDTIYQDAGLAPDTEYSYRVYAVFDEITSDPSNTDRATTSTEAPRCSNDNVNCLESPITDSDVVLEVDDACEVTSAQMIAEADVVTPDPDEYSYPLGLVDFTADCGTPGFTTSVTQYFYDPPAGDFVLRKYVNGAYQTIEDATIETTTINGRAVLVVSYSITDGGPLDDDETAGIIVDPAGPAVLAASSNNSGGQNTDESDDLGAPNTGLMRTNMAVYGIAMGAGLVLLIPGIISIRRRLVHGFAKKS